MVRMPRAESASIEVSGCPCPGGWKFYRAAIFHKRQLAAEGNGIYFPSGDLSASDTSLVDLVERHRGPLPPELMPLPSSDRDSPLEWTHLVDVASTFETERNTHYGNGGHKCQHMWSSFIRRLNHNTTWSLKLSFLHFLAFPTVQRSFVFGESNHRSSGASSPQQPHIELQPVPLSRPTSR